MKPAFDAALLDRLRAAVSSRLGLQLEDSNVEPLATLASERVEAGAARSGDAYVRAVEAGEPVELKAIAARVTVGETYFFRNANDLAAFSGEVLPERLRARAGERRLRMLSAGCSSGEEPYTLAMLARDHPDLAGWDVEITGVDVNPSAIARARAARYGPWSLRQTSDAARARFFQEEGREVRVRDDVRALVRFEERNLLDEDGVLWTPGVWDVVFCRNVLMYFSRETMSRIVSRIARALAPGGYLFLGHAETLRGISSDFHLLHTHGTFYYQRREGAAPAGGVAAAFVAASPTPPPLLDPDLDWLDAIRMASERIAGLSRSGAALTGPAPGVDRPPAPAAAVGVPDVARALALLREERFAEALAALGPAAADGTDTDALLLRAVILASSGDPGAADAVCARILELDELSAEAHYVKALCREHARDREGAANHDHYALYLDPTFAMPRLHLGLMAKRTGDLEGARRELARALALLAGEDAARILLLGGGFTRAALVDVCRAELRACGGAP